MNATKAAAVLSHDTAARRPMTRVEHSLFHRMIGLHEGAGPATAHDLWTRCACPYAVVVREYRDRFQPGEEGCAA